MTDSCLILTYKSQIILVEPERDGQIATAFPHLFFFPFISELYSVRKFH